MHNPIAYSQCNKIYGDFLQNTILFLKKRSLVIKGS